MSTLNMHPPQTYSRLFRPWDNNKTHERSCAMEQQQQQHRPTAYIKKENDNENCRSSERDYRDMEAELQSRSGGDCATGECGSNSSFKSSSNEDSEPSGCFMPHPQLSPQAAQQILLGTRLSQEPSPHHQLPLLNSLPASNSDYYYAAALAAANGLPTPPQAAPLHFGVDPYTIGLMEQEYARVIAEEAHIKAINARKQRPKKFKCPHCEVAFSNNGQLKGHIRIHTGERPFKCDIETCGKTFTRNEELTRHKRIHTGLRPYPCSVCGKKFGRRDHLKKHMKTHLPQERQLGPAIFVPMYPYLYGY